MRNGTRRWLRVLAVAGLAGWAVTTAGAVPQVEAPAGAGAAASAVAPSAAAGFDPVAATEAYLDRLTPEQKARSDSYFEGGYWLQLWGFLYGLGVAWLLLDRRWSAAMRSAGERVTRFAWLRNFIYALQYLAITFVLGFPLSLYVGFFREHQYGMSTQTFAGWMGDQAKGLAVSLVLGSLAIVGLYAVLKRAPRTWWIWGTVVSLVFMMIGALIAPVFINPIFNDYTRLEDPVVRGPILSLARSNGVPATDVWVSDASRQTTRISANVSGFLGTERITLNDNLLSRTSQAEIEAVMGHEIGHYALNHVYEMIFELGIVIALGFGFLYFAFERARRRWGSGWGISGIADVAGLPLLSALLSVFFFVMTPVTNTIIRVNEVEADIFGLNAARQPDGFAEVSLKLGEYRKLSPGPIEELIFFDHPSGRNRILMAMRWKAEHLSPP